MKQKPNSYTIQVPDWDNVGIDFKFCTVDADGRIMYWQERPYASPLDFRWRAIGKAEKIEPTCSDDRFGKLPQYIAFFVFWGEHIWERS